MRTPKRVRYHSAPWLKIKQRRRTSGVQFPPALLLALRAIAEQEGRSLSWVVEEILIDWARSDGRLRKMLSGDALAYAPRVTPESIVDSDTVHRAIGTVLRRIRAA